jgi:hypothetical protein
MAEQQKYIPISVFSKITIGKAEKWLVDMAKEAGFDIDGFEHEVTSHFINHALKSHGNRKKESGRGQIALTENDFDKISELLKNPDYIVFGVKTKGKNIISYSKKFSDNTTLYFEEILDSKRKHSLLSRTMFKRKNDLNSKQLLSIISGTNGVDMTNAQIKSPRYTGGRPGFAATIEESPAAAVSTQPAGLIALLSPRTPNRSSPVSQETEQINGKEFTMPDVSENTEETVGSADVSEEIIEGRGEPKTPEEVAFLNTLHQRRVIAESLENGKLPCLPGAGGYADTSPAVNIASNTRYHGVNLLYLKDFQARNGFPSAEYVTRDQIDKARSETNDQIFIRKDQKPVTVSFQVKNEGTGEWDQKNVLLYNVAQTTKPWALKAWAEQREQKEQQDRQDFKKEYYGTGSEPPEPRQKGPGPEITCSSAEPEKYLAQYLAAVSMGGKFKASPEQAKEFAANLKDAVFERGTGGHTDPFKLSKICQAAGRECKDVMREAGREQRQNIQQAREQKQEQKISRGVSR